MITDILDPEVAKLVGALNGLPGIETTESCCGHGKVPFRIWFNVTDYTTRGLLTIARVMCPRYGGSPLFKVILYHNDTPPLVSYLLEGDTSTDTFRVADEIAENILAHINGVTPGFNILKDPMKMEIKSDEPCGHPGCLSHISHPCEVCGKIAGQSWDRSGYTSNGRLDLS